jgi:hypothetical protein
MKLTLPPLVLGVALVFIGQPASAQTDTKPPTTYPALPTEIPAKFKPKRDSFDHTRRRNQLAAVWGKNQ